jgi:long-chain acyl-CoA synthetase
MKGYHNRPEDTSASMTPDGGFRTGDRGQPDKDGFLRTSSTGSARLLRTA